jgi:hypothetical protein
LSAPDVAADGTKLIASNQTIQQTESAAMHVRIPEDQYEMVRDFLLRRHTLQHSARTRLGSLLAKRISVLMDQPLPLPEQTESYLEYVAKHYEM